MQPRLPLECVLQVLQPRLLLADGAAAGRLERSQLLQLLSVDPVSLLREATARQCVRENVKGHFPEFAYVGGHDYRGRNLTAKMTQNWLRSLGLELGKAAQHALV